MNFIAKLIDTVKLYRVHKDIDRIKPTSRTLKALVKNADGYRNDKSDSYRKFLYMSIIKQLRVRFPFKPTDYSKAKKLYDDYFKMDNHIPSYEHIFKQVKNGEEIYVVNFRFDAPTKGCKFNDYYINGSGTEGCGRIFNLKDVTIKPKYSYINMYSPKGYANISGIEESFFTNYRYATDKEISNFKKFESKIESIQKELDYHQEIKMNLYKEMELCENSEA